MPSWHDSIRNNSLSVWRGLIRFIIVNDHSEEAAVDVATISVTPLSAHTGAEISGVDLRGPVDGETRDRLNQAFVDHSVFAIRDKHRSAAEFLEAMKIFGDIFWQHNPRFAVPECPQIHYISNQDTFEDGRAYIPGEGYHTDHSNAVEPPKDHGASRHQASEDRRRRAIRQHVQGLRGASRDDEGAHRRPSGAPRLPEQPQRGNFRSSSRSAGNRTKVTHFVTHWPAEQGASSFTASETPKWRPGLLSCGALVRIQPGSPN
jgi:Taurine catabolism dioxygenase TauD, TfdA family